MEVIGLIKLRFKKTKWKDVGIVEFKMLNSCFAVADLLSNNNFRLNTAIQIVNRKTIPYIKLNAKKYDLKKLRKRIFKTSYRFLIL
jgi:hypothetical protein